MKKLLIAMFVGIPLVGCTTETIIKKVPPPAEEPLPEESSDATNPEPEETNDKKAPDSPGAKSKAIEDRCLDGQDMDAPDVDVSSCPPIPSAPKDALMGTEKGTQKISLGAWELGTTGSGETYKYGTLSPSTSAERTLTYDTGSEAVNAGNLECWAKGYYRLRKILQEPPAEYVALYNAGFQYRFFQFQTDLRNGPTGYKEIASFQDHLVKWVTVISKQGACQQPTLSKFRSYAKSELSRRGLPLPTAD